MERSEQGAPRERAKVVTGDRAVRTGNDVVRTTEDLVEGTSEPVVPSVVTPAIAVRCLHDRFGAVLEAEYIPGKTEIRDALSASLALSELAAEDLCDELERAGRIGFIDTGEGFGWHIHAEDLTEAG
jgi:hypothetical protein